jgi:hypothetical protein
MRRMRQQPACWHAGLKPRNEPLDREHARGTLPFRSSVSVPTASHVVIGNDSCSRPWPPRPNARKSATPTLPATATAQRGGCALLSVDKAAYVAHNEAVLRTVPSGAGQHVLNRGTGAA